MSQINLENSSFNSTLESYLSKIVKLIAYLVALYIQGHYFPYNKHEYNYTYINPLAITNVPENKTFVKILGLPFPNLPKGEFPSRMWFLKVVFSLVITGINNYLHNQNYGSLEAIKNEFNDIKIQLETIVNDFSEVENKKELKNIFTQLTLSLKKIDEDLQIEEKLKNSRQQKSSEQIESSIQCLIEKHFQEIDSKIPQDLNQNPQGDADNLEASEQSIIASLREITKYSARLAELADNKTPSLSSSQSEPDLDDYDQLFQIIDKPAISHTFQQDKIFAYLQVAGPNPVVLQQVTRYDSRLPITEEQYSQIAQKFGASDSLAAALGEGRLYVADYTLLDGLVNGTYLQPNLQQQKYVFSPVSLFAVPPYGSPSRSLFPVAISYQQTSVSYHWVMFTPLDADSNGEPWMTAKNIVELADCDYQALISHLGRTHLFVEAFVVPTNNLPNNHPLRNLLKPHLEGTVFINFGAHTVLVAPEGTVDSLLGSSIGGDQSLTAKAAQSYLFNFNEVSFPQTLVSRGVDDTSKLPTYPYRDDGLLIWNAIQSWVSDYFSIYYSNDSSVQQDKDLQTWASTLISFQGGRLQNFGDDGQGQIKTLAYLVKAVSTVIFTASAQHAAVNYPQKEFMMYAPAFPFARYFPAPTNTQESQSFVQGLPSLAQAQGQINLLYLLGSVYYTNLGNYSTSAFPTDTRVQDALKKFQNNLRDITHIINQRNRSNDRLIPYEFLLPAKIPQSINI
jgi:arachidonate 15-lipoxygenase